jgi:hypothetical protein
MSQNNKVVATLSAGGINEIPNLKTCETNSVEELVVSINDILNEDTSSNRILFDTYLSKRTLDSFNDTILKKLNIS